LLYLWLIDKSLCINTMVKQESENIILYIVGLIALLLSVSLFVFSFYITPYIVLDFVYDVPEFIILNVYWYKTIYGLEGVRLIATVLLPFLIAATFLALVARRLTRRVERSESSKHFALDGQLTKNLGKHLRPAMYEICMIVLVLVLLYLTEFIIVFQYV